MSDAAHLVGDAIGRVLRMPTPCDLTEASFHAARRLLGGPPPHTLYVVCSPYYGGTGHDLINRYGLTYVEVPEEMMASKSGWAVIGRDGTVWSPGLP